MIINYPALIKAIYDKCQDAIVSGEDWQFMENKTTFAIFDSELKAAFDATVLDFGGHNQGTLTGHTLADLAEDAKEPYSTSARKLETIKERTTNALKYFVRDIYKAIKQDMSYDDIEKEVLSKPSYFYTMPILVQGSPGTYCFVCGVSSGYYMKDGVISAGCKIKSGTPEWEALDELYQIMLRGEGDSLGSTCAYPDGIEPFDQYITIRSNHLVFNDDLRHVIKLDPMESMDYISKRSGYHNNINSELGSMYEQAYALDKGLIKIQVGNSSPIVAYNAETGTILGADPNAWKSKKRYTFPFDVTGFRAKGSICTDVWTVQAVDSIVFEDEAKENEMTLEATAAEYGFLVPVTPGKYKITNYNSQHGTKNPVFFQWNE